MEALERELDELAAATRFSGVVRVDRGAETVLARTYRFADRRWRIPNDGETRFGLASGTKGLTALTVVSLVEEGVLELATRARALLGDDLPLIGDDVTVEHLLAHRSGIGDYFDEDVETDAEAYVLAVAVNQLSTTEAYLAVLDGHPTKFRSGERFSYSNSGYVVLALLAERATGVPFHELVVERVCEPAGLRDTAFLRSDELPAGTALGYVGDEDSARTNVFHLPVLGSGDGGIYSTAADVRSLWTALFAGAIVSREWVDEMVRPRSEAGSKRYGLGFWLDASSDVVMLEGMDAGVSFRSAHDPHADFTWTVVSNTTHGAWPLVRHLERHARP